VHLKIDSLSCLCHLLQSSKPKRVKRELSGIPSLFHSLSE
jgi:hypothetical protein